MSEISYISLTNFRNLSSDTLDFHPHINFISGVNGSGKTSLFEAIHITSQGQSFRTNNLAHCIKFNQKKFLLFAQYKNHKVGLSKSSQNVVTKINEKVIYKRSELVKLSPIKIINSDSLALISGSPKYRRQFLDWVLFHVKPSYGKLVYQFTHALKQRNRILKVKKDLDQLSYWDNYIVEYSDQISKDRSKNINLLKATIDENLNDLIADLNISISYHFGNQSHVDLATALNANRSRDIKFGFTSSGCHRADFDLHSDGVLARDVLSRGQEKRLALALIISQILIISEHTNKKIILLIDDLDAELDSESINLVFKHLKQLDIQLFISRLVPSIPEQLEDKQYKMFHVEHGMIRARKN